MRLHTDSEMVEAEVSTFCGGTAAAFSAPSPAKDRSSSPNEDAAGLIEISASTGVLIVADGLGGIPAGEQASKVALEALARSIQQSEAANGELRSAILEGFERANQAVIGLGLDAGTTLVVAEVQGSRIRPYHVGDSSLMIAARSGRLEHLTVAHSPVGYAVAAGLLDEREAMHHEARHLISNIVGSPDMTVEVGTELSLEPGDTLLLASDGLFDNMHVDEIAQAARQETVEATMQHLVETCRTRMTNPTVGLPSKPDDHTIIAWRR